MGWDELSPCDREFYGYCVTALLARRSLLEAAANDDVIPRHSEEGEQAD